MLTYKHLLLCVFACSCRPFRPSLSSFSRLSGSLKPVQELSLQGDNLLKDIRLIGGNDSGIFISYVQSGSNAEKAGLREGHHLMFVCHLLPECFNCEKIHGGSKTTSVKTAGCAKRKAL